MADAMISALLNQLALVTREYAGKKVKLIRGVNKELENLQGNLVAIRAVLTDAEMRQLKDEAVKLWLEDLKNVTYDMDSVLDECNTVITAAADQITKPKVWSSILLSCFCPSKLSYHLRVGKEIQGINKRLERITLRKVDFSFTETSDSSLKLERPDNTTSFLDVPIVYGQRSYKQNLIDRLRLSESDQNDKELKFIPIVGMGGIGKTTLARNTYNDAEVKTLFEGNMIWVCVSDPFDFARIAKEIIEQVSGETPTVVGSESLMRKFHDSVKDRKFLLVLDDVWTTKYNEWAPLQQVLRCSCAAGSRVVVTTRNEEVAKMVGDEYMIRVDKLAEEDCWFLLRDVALSSRREQATEDFDTIGRKIAQKCNGLPLAAKTLGGLLRVKDIKYWGDILTSELWELKNVEVELFNPLLFSYYDLTSVERRCFLYCAIFPKDNVFERDDLIQQWVAQGYFKSTSNDECDIEQTGQICFQNLAMRSFFQDFRYDKYDSTIRCKMHDIVHDFVQYLTKNEYSVESISDARKRVKLDVRHLNLNVASSVMPTFSNINKKNLHSLIVTCDSKCMVLNSSSSTHMFPHELLDMKCLKTLILNGKSMELPTDFSGLIHLRYLSIFSDNIIDVPTTIGNLFNLQTLKFFGWITGLPEEVGKLKNLRHLRLVRGCTQSWPKSIGNMTSLQTLENGHSYLNDGKLIRVRDFRNLNNLRKIWLKGLGREEHKREAMEAQLHNKTALEHLTLKFTTEDTKVETHEIVLENLRPHENLKYLRIDEYFGRSIYPSWMTSLINLRSLYLFGCYFYDTLPPLGRLPCLESLDIYLCFGLKKMGPEFLGVENNGNTSAKALFPKLKLLRIRYIESLEEWIGVAGWPVNGSLKIMPSLEFLELTRCCCLKGLPDFLKSTPLKKLEITYCHFLRISCNSDTRAGKDWPKIRHVPNINIT